MGCDASLSQHEFTFSIIHLCLHYDLQLIAVLAQLLRFSFVQRVPVDAEKIRAAPIFWTASVRGTGKCLRCVEINIIVVAARERALSEKARRAPAHVVDG